MKLPFWIMPGSWGLRGITRKRAELEYNYTGLELERELFILENDMSNIINQETLITYDYNLKKYTKEEYRLKISELYKKYQNELAIKKLNWQLEDDEIDQNDYELELANINKEPFMKILDSDFDLNHGLDGMQLKAIWNEYFVEYLRMNGYKGSEDAVVAQYLSDIISESATTDF